MIENRENRFSQDKLNLNLSVAKKIGITNFAFFISRNTLTELFHLKNEIKIFKIKYKQKIYKWDIKK